ncbi:uncharacterized protein FIESC28_09142 [Fusarium coffeatum]|uniref:Fungal N-terminal domain-containing protein n=1 Tax=Fusarium coffeatum TaxID=231269 RepID=A0A366R411_9HYPO|nr:uncharacterized protein FIESC28_09142 [Fusarium coffeatum]RBR11258.1 hypothetical protein FIESC28_09142 [Fusarium coffeatum]
MAEILGVVASVITIVNLAGPTAKLIETLYKVAKDGDEMENAIISVANQLEVADETMKLAKRRLQDNCDKIRKMKHPTSRVARYIEGSSLEQKISHITKDIERQLDVADNSLVDTCSRFKFVQGLRWYFWTIDEMRAVFISLDRVAIYLSIIGFILELEVFSYMLERTDDEISGMLEEHIATLRMQLQHTERTLDKALRSEQSKKSHRKDLNTEFVDCGKLLISLSESMRCTGKVPDDRDERRRRRDRNRPTQSTMSAYAGVTRTPRSPPRSRKPTESPHPSRLRVPKARLSEISQETSRSSRSLSSRTTHTPERPSPPSPPSPSPDPDDEMIYLFTPADVKEEMIYLINGWLENRTGRNGVARIEHARVCPKMSGNYISIAQARELSLPVEQLGFREVIHKVGPNEYEQIIGKVSGVQWWGKKHWRPRLVDFWVKEEYCLGKGDDIMFGSEFAKEETGWKEVLYK